ncbi:helix-turn-helix domain-containing protein [Hyphomonas sp.]|uniref:AraC family transcriptional regulator n=1 Tax=Hyphomonas sp. TaxID=87 RepID=UPI003526C4CD
MLLLDVLLRYPAAAVLLVSAVLLLRDAGKLIQGWFGAGLSISVAAMLIGTPPEILEPPWPVLVVVRFIDMPNTLFLWLFGRSLFDDGFRMRAADWAVAALYLVLILVLRLANLGFIDGRPEWVAYLTNFVSFLMAVHLGWIALAGWRNDLVESRRSTRPLFAILLATVVVLIVLSEALFSRTHEHLVTTFRAGLTLIMATWGLLWLVSLRSEALLFQPVPKPAPPPAVSAKESVLLARLMALMDEEQVFTEQGLTIGALADRAGVPEHQLRALINRGLGHRNFAAFLNGYRIALAKQKLSDPALARIPVLTIAMDAGFASLAPFNRAFRVMEGVTPTEYRDMALAKAGRN